MFDETASPASRRARTADGRYGGRCCFRRPLVASMRRLFDKWISGRM